MSKLTLRRLPRDEWHRLAGTELATAWQYLPIRDSEILVVEAEDGTVIGCWAAIRYVHVEGLWVDPAYRRPGLVSRALWTGMQTLVRGLGVQAVLTAALTDDVRRLIVHAGGTKLPGDHYVLPMGGH
jgi:ribosomal protein S18 acetylase RimI-like enzyme